jgi:hypothetical protein
MRPRGNRFVTAGAHPAQRVRSTAPDLNLRQGAKRSAVSCALSVLDEPSEINATNEV